MKNIFRHILFFAAINAMAVSCLSSSIEGDRQATVIFRPVLENNVRSSGDTGTFPENASFGVWGITENGEIYMEREKVTAADNSWNTSRPYLWPENSGLHFMAFAPYETDFSLENNSLVLNDFDMSEADSPLYVVRNTSVFTEKDSTVQLAFSPATARLDFRIANGLGHGTEVIVEKIILEGIHVKGNYSSSLSSEWKTSGEKQDLTVYDISSGNDKGGTYACSSGSTDQTAVTDMGELLGNTHEYYGRTLEVIPQNSLPRIKVVYSFSVNGSGWLEGQTDCTDYMMSGWKPGRRYTYSMTITGSSIKYTTGISSWSGSEKRNGQTVRIQRTENK